MSKYTDDVYAATGIVNPWMLREKYRCPVLYFHTQHPHAFGTRDHRSEVHFYRGGEPRKSKPIRVRDQGGSLASSREAHLQAAIEWAEKKDLGVEEWVPSGWPGAWIPKLVKDQLMVELKEWRRQQKVAAKDGKEKSG